VLCTISASVLAALVTDEAARLTTADVRDGVVKLSLGKKRHVVLKAI
jgi:hypothetical protein